MKKTVFLALLVISFTGNAQSLKDLLYSGKLKSDSNTLIKKTDDLSTKIDTARKKPVETEKAKGAIAIKDSANKGLPVSGDPLVIEKKEESVAPKDNNQVWKAYMDSIVSSFKEEVLPNKKIKEGTYYLLIEYEIGTDGQVNINNVSCTPESDWLQDQVKQRLTLTAPRLNPVVAGNGVARKVNKKQNFSLTKQ